MTVSAGQKHVQRLFRFIFANLGIAQKLTLVLAYHCKAKNCSFQNGENLVGRFEVMFSSGPWFSFSVHSGIHVNFHSFPLIGGSCCPSWPKVVGGLLYVASASLLLRLRIDDPVNAFPETLLQKHKCQDVFHVQCIQNLGVAGVAQNL